MQRIYNVDTKYTPSNPPFARMKAPNSPSESTGFSLIELLAVMAIVGMLQSLRCLLSIP